MDMPIDHIMCGVLWWATIKDTRQSWPSCRDERPFCRRHRIICFTSSLIKQLYHFAADFDRVLLQMVDNGSVITLFQCRISSRYSWLKHLNCWRKAAKNFICYSWIFNVICKFTWKKWTLKFKLLYLRNHISYSNNVCSICCVNTRIQSLKVWLKSVLLWLKYSIFF